MRFQSRAADVSSPCLDLSGRLVRADPYAERLVEAAHVAGRLLDEINEIDWYKQNWQTVAPKPNLPLRVLEAIT